MECCDSPRSCCSRWADKSFSLGSLQTIGSLNHEKNLKNLNLTKFNPNWNIFDTTCVVKYTFFLISMRNKKVGNSCGADFSWMSPNEDRGRSDGCSFTVASEKPVSNLCATRHYFQLFPRDLKPLFHLRCSGYRKQFPVSQFPWRHAGGHDTDAFLSVRIGDVTPQTIKPNLPATCYVSSLKNNWRWS